MYHFAYINDFATVLIAVNRAFAYFPSPHPNKNELRITFCLLPCGSYQTYLILKVGLMPC